MEQIKQLVDIGGTAIVTVMLYLVWRRLSELTDRFIDILIEFQAEREKTAADKLIAERLLGGSDRADSA